MPAKTAIAAAISAPLLVIAALAAVAGAHRRRTRLAHDVDVHGRPRRGTCQY